MAAVGLTDVDERQHHEDEGLKQNNQDMEKPPDQTCEDLTNTSTNSPNGTKFESETAEKRQQEEQQFTSIHVAEESHAERDELGEVLNDVQQEVERPESGMTAERRSKQFMHEAAEALDLHAVVAVSYTHLTLPTKLEDVYKRQVEEKEEHAQRHAERAVEVSSRQRTEMIEADQTSNRGEQVNRNQVDGVHQRDPAEHG